LHHSFRHALNLGLIVHHGGLDAARFANDALKEFADRMVIEWSWIIRLHPGYYLLLALCVIQRQTSFLFKSADLCRQPRSRVEQPYELIVNIVDFGSPILNAHFPVLPMRVCWTKARKKKTSRDLIQGSRLALVETFWRFR
jgi:hypothetical protein